MRDKERIKGEILDILEDECIFEIALSEDKKSVEIEEACDNWFFKELDKEDFGKLIKELQSIYNQMI
jgi:septum formation inhibitor-activating ATPase MinD